eukprot:TRINITY_DN3343_c0_g1_i1.p1 TRINITY_DN3343_c0_g1~~TRINITY_DN3343_c0_g1_i1.p1  ORF type:complete len:228 (+),score=49.30 TRINITY_DN3343_c0_g1_i1:33-686(+)
MDAKAIAQLLERSRYNVDILPDLEAYLDKQLNEKTYDLEANLAILKLYQFSPDKIKPQIVAKIVVKALMNMPNPDFLFTSSLIPEKLYNSEPISLLINLARLLESCRFTEFWTETSKVKELLSTVPGFDEAVRTFIISVLRMTYQTISKEYVGQLLNLSGAELDAYVNQNRISSSTVGDKTVLTFPLTEENQVKPKRVTENIRFDQLSKIILHKGTA